MMQEKTQESENLNEIISILNQINKDIILLHRYAAEDFTLMRSVFRENNYKAEKLEKNAKKAFELIGATKNSPTLVNDLENYFNNVYSRYNYVKTRIGAIENYVGKLLHYFELMTIPVKNLNQQTVSLKLVLANIKLYPSFHAQLNSGYKELELMADRIKSQYAKFYERFESIKNLLKKVMDNTEQFVKSGLEQLNDFLNKIEKCKVQFLQNNHEAYRQIPELSSKIIDNIGNSHKIIIELQYHDIIRQKIEHVQETHDQIIRQLTQFKMNQDAETDEVIKYLEQVGDIVRIQASQLLQANKEYETAIDIISEELLSFSDNMTGIINLCSRLSYNKDILPQCGMDEMVKTNEHFIKKLPEINKILAENYNVIESELNQLCEDFKHIPEFINKLNAPPVFAEEQNGDFEESRKLSNNQIYELMKDLTSTTIYIKKLFDSIDDKSDYQFIDLINGNTQNQFENLNEIMQNFSQKILPCIYQDNETIAEIFNENHNYTKNLADNILHAIRSIKYYDYFDKLANNIIQKLNYISNTYHACESNIINPDLEHIKGKYTMNSERRIHDITIEHGQGNVELFDESNVKDNPNNTELF